MKAGCGKTARPVCAADGGKVNNGRLLRPDSDEVAVMAMERRSQITQLPIGGNCNWLQEVRR